MLKIGKQYIYKKSTTTKRVEGSTEGGKTVEIIDGGEGGVQIDKTITTTRSTTESEGAANGGTKRVTTKTTITTEESTNGNLIEIKPHGEIISDLVGEQITKTRTTTMCGAYLDGNGKVVSAPLAGKKITITEIIQDRKGEEICGAYLGGDGEVVVVPGAGGSTTTTTKTTEERQEICGAYLEGGQVVVVPGAGGSTTTTTTTTESTGPISGGESVTITKETVESQVVGCVRPVLIEEVKISQCVLNLPTVGSE